MDNTDIRPKHKLIQDRSLMKAIIPAMVVLVGVTVVPFIFLVFVSFTPFDLTRPQTWMDLSTPLSGYQNLIHDERFIHSLEIQVKLSIATVSMQLFLGLLGAMLLNVQSIFISILRTLLLIPMVLPPIVGAIIWKVLYTDAISPINWLLGLLGLPQPIWLADPTLALVAIIIADIWMWFPFVLLSILAALQTIPNELVDAACVDGASPFRIFLNIILPFIRPTIFVVALFRLIDSIKAFPLIYVLTQGGPGIATEPTNYYAYLKGFSFGFIGYSSTIALLMLLISFAISLGIFLVVGREVEIE